MWTEVLNELKQLWWHLLCWLSVWGQQIALICTGGILCFRSQYISLLCFGSAVLCWGSWLGNWYLARAAPTRSSCRGEGNREQLRMGQAWMCSWCTWRAFGPKWLLQKGGNSLWKSSAAVVLGRVGGDVQDSFFCLSIFPLMPDHLRQCWSTAARLLFESFCGAGGW